MILCYSFALLKHFKAPREEKEKPAKKREKGQGVRESMVSENAQAG